MLRGEVKGESAMHYYFFGNAFKTMLNSEWQTVNLIVLVFFWAFCENINAIPA